MYLRLNDEDCGVRRLRCFESFWGAVILNTPRRLASSRNYCQPEVNLCRGKMRMSGLCKVEMSGFIQGGRQDGTGANRVECERAGAVEGVTRSRARTSETGGSGATSATD